MAEQHTAGSRKKALGVTERAGAKKAAGSGTGRCPALSGQVLEGGAVGCAGLVRYGQLACWSQVHAQILQVTVALGNGSGKFVTQWQGGARGWHWGGCEANCQGV